jgi:hypothetical protein
MPSTYSPSLRIELIGEGEQDGIWGQTTNNNLGELIEQAIAGITTVDVTAANVTLTSFNGTVDEARSAILVVTGSNAVAREVTIPNEPKTYIVTNNTSQTVGVKTPAGTAFSCATDTQTTLYCDGSNGVFGASIVLNPPPPPTYETFVNPLITGIRETATVSATAATGTINFDTLTQAVLYYTSNASGNWTVNVRGNSGTTLNSLMATGQSFSITFLVTQGGTAYYNNAFAVDGSSVTPKWQGGTAPTSGNTSGIDIYTYAIIKTANATFTVLASQTKFA